MKTLANGDGALQPLATASYNEHSLLATVNVLRAVIAAAAQVRFSSSSG